MKLDQEKMNALLHFVEQFVQHNDAAIEDHVDGFETRSDIEALLQVDKLFFDSENTEAYKNADYWNDPMTVAKENL